MVSINRLLTLILSVILLSCYSIYSNGVNRSPNEPPLDDWCQSSAFLYHLDYMKRNFPSQYKYCTTKASTCKSPYWNFTTKWAANNIRAKQGKQSRNHHESLDHRKFLMFCKAVQTTPAGTLSKRQYIVITVNIMVDSSSSDFLIRLLSKGNGRQHVEDYVNGLFKDAGRILSAAFDRKTVVFRILKISIADLPRTPCGDWFTNLCVDHVLCEDAQAVYNSWCQHASIIFRSPEPEADEAGQANSASADMQLILSKRFAQSTNHAGYTLKSGMCSGHWSCVIVQDDGPQLTPAVVAHETVHLLGLSHVEEMSECAEELASSEKTDRKYFVMSEEVQANNARYIWSQCVRRYLERIDMDFACLRKSKRHIGHLLNHTNYHYYPASSSDYGAGDTAVLDDETGSHRCPYSPDAQCKMIFNDMDSELCKTKRRQRMVCSQLYCSAPSRTIALHKSAGRVVMAGQKGQPLQSSAYICHSKRVGALEHTTCANGQGECIKGRCMRLRRN